MAARLSSVSSTRASSRATATTSASVIAGIPTGTVVIAVILPDGPTRRADGVEYVRGHEGGGAGRFRRSGPTQPRRGAGSGAGAGRGADRGRRHGGEPGRPAPA